MTLNELIWKHLTSYDDEAEVVAMTLVLKHTDNSITCYGVDDYGSFFKKDVGE